MHVEKVSLEGKGTAKGIFFGGQYSKGNAKGAAKATDAAKAVVFGGQSGQGNAKGQQRPQRLAGAGKKN